jgi:cell division septal protein FtsQ
VRAGAATARLLPRTATFVPRAALRLPPRLRRGVGALLAAALVLAGAYIGWFRDSSLVAVERVTITGLTVADAPRVRRSLELAARDMTTLHLRRDELAEAVRAYPAIRAVEARADFPHGLRIQVIEHRPVAVLARERVPLAADGTLLRGIPTAGRLPVVSGPGAVAGDRVSGAQALALVRVAAGVPAPLVRRVGRVRLSRGRGIVAALRDGPEVVFGSAAHARAKWLAAVRVLADPSSQGASYIDVRIPQRPTAGGLAVETIAPVAPASEAGAPASGAQEQPQPPASQGTAPAQPATPQAGTPQAGTPQPGTPQPQTAPQSAPPTATAPPTGGATPASP